MQSNLVQFLPIEALTFPIQFSRFCDFYYKLFHKFRSLYLEVDKTGL
ncbi:hypothetical protein SYGD1_45 [Escherichia phage vB_EcoM_SYGD1]|nr:hypothetical protein SYGD1_45 [Escherichia phage vB_EcoM_SYGD1]